MPENRKYLAEEINYVLSRVLAGWTPEDIAEAFKRDHALYWANKEFTRRQVSYIKNTYKVPPGSIEPYKEPELPQQDYFTASPLTRLLMMTPTQQNATQAKDEVVAPSSGSHDNSSGFIGHQASFNASNATGLTAAQAAISQAEGITLNPSVYGSNDLMVFNDLSATDGYINPGTNTNQANFSSTLHGHGGHFNNFGNARVSDLNAEDQAFLEDLLPVIDNEQAAAVQAQAGGGQVPMTTELSQHQEIPQQHQQQQTGNQLPMIASAFQDLSTSATQPEHGQQQVHEADTIMQSIECDPDTANNDGGKTPTQTTATLLAGSPLPGGEYSFPYSPPFDINTASLHQPAVPSRDSLPLPVASPTPQLPGNVRLHSSLEAAVAGMVDLESSPGGGVIEFYFAPHGSCTIALEHGHHNTNGSIVFRSEAKFHEAYAAMKRMESPAFFPSQNPSPAHGVQSTGGGWPYNPAHYSRALPPLGRGSRQTQAHRFGSNAASLSWMQTPQTADSNATTAQARPPLIRGGPGLGGYYDVYSGSQGDYQSINPHTRAANRANPQGNPNGEGLDLSTRSRRQSQQSTEARQPPSMPYRNGHSVSPYPLAPLAAASGPPYHHGSASSSIFSPSVLVSGLPATTNAMGVGNGFATTSSGQHGIASGGSTYMSGVARQQQQDAMLTGPYYPGTYVHQYQPPPQPSHPYQQVGAQMHGYTHQTSGGTQQQQHHHHHQQSHNLHRHPRPGESAYHPVHLDGGSSEAGHYLIDDDDDEEEEEEDDHDVGLRFG